MELISTYKAVKWPVLAFVGLAVGLCTGYALKGIEEDLQRASVEGLCRPSKSWAAHVSTDDAGYVCFKEQIFTKRLIKYIIVEKDHE
jgi:hypothetical protein